MADASFSQDVSVNNIEEMEHFSRLSEITKDRQLIEKWCISLADYIFIEPDEEIQSGSYIRYIDLRRMSPVLTIGAFVRYVSDDTIYLRSFYERSTRSYWTIKRPFYVIFRKKVFRDRLLLAVEKLENKFKLGE